ncbi:hypothetical protein [Halosimplex salinum]|uniref:hypothetical protein n=1 Tax=Halosimplex salinum TaxID=1710538 RepID=UPI000F461600|nr:hypothetical protein [Halosimplex salinum]
MTTGTQSHTDADSDAGPEPTADDRPAISACESCPGRSVFIESGNTDGWIASDETLEVRR